MNEDAAPEAVAVPNRYVRPHVLLAALPFRSLLATFSMIVRLGNAKLRRLDALPPAYLNPAELPLDLSDETMAAIDRSGGGEAVLRALVRLDRLSLPTVATVMTKGLDRCGDRIEVRGFERVRESRRAGHPVVVIEPHIGPFQMVGVHLLLSGEHVAGFSALKEVASDWYRLVFRWFAPHESSEARFSEISAFSPTSSLQALRLLRSGAVLLWNPLVFTFMGRSRTQPIQFLGLEVEVSPTVTRLAKQNKADVYLAHARLFSDREGPRLQVTYEAVEAPPGDDEGAELRHLYRLVETRVLENVDQWFGWRWLPIEAAAARENAAKARA